MARFRQKPPTATSTTTRAIRRRRFLRLLAAGGAAVVAGVAAPGIAAAPAKATAKAPQEARRKPKRGDPARPAAVERELENQRKSIADTLRVIRDYELPPGGDLAIVFRPMRARRKGR